MYWEEGMSQAEIATQLGVSQKVIWLAMDKAQIPKRVARARNQKKGKNPNWRGGRVLMAKQAKRSAFCDAGYWYIHKPEHPHATKGGYVAEHIFVATKSAGRMLQPGECVHHKDLNKRNNRSDNLLICPRKRHRQYHVQLELIAIQLYRKGLVEFRNENYVVSNELQEVIDARK